MVDLWRMVALGEVAEIALSSVDKLTDSTEVPVSLCNYVDVYKNNRIMATIEFMQASATRNEIDRFALRKGDILITKDSETPDDIGVPALVAEKLENIICGYHLALIRPTNIDSSYLFWQLQSDATKQHYLRTANGVTRFGIGIKAIKKTAIPLPPPAEQQAIAHILDAVDTAIERAREALARAQDVKLSLMQQLFQDGTQGEALKKTRIGHIPVSWEIVSVESVVSRFEYGLSVPMQQEGIMPILRMGNIQQGEVILQDLKYVTLPTEMMEPYIAHRGDILFNRTNSQEHVGKVGIYRSDSPSVFASYLIRVVTNPALVDNYFLGHLLNSYDCQCRIKRYATPGVQQVNINATNLGKVLIPLPVGESGLEEQRRIAAILEKADECIRVRKPLLESLLILRRSLMHDLLSGKVRVGTVKQLNLFGE